MTAFTFLAAALVVVVSIGWWLGRAATRIGRYEEQLHDWPRI